MGKRNMRILLVVVGAATSGWLDVAADQANDWLLATSTSTAAYVSQKCWLVSGVFANSTKAVQILHVRRVLHCIARRLLISHYAYRNAPL